jgi:hypothetical protein
LSLSSVARFQFIEFEMSFFVVKYSLSSKRIADFTFLKLFFYLQLKLHFGHLNKKIVVIRMMMLSVLIERRYDFLKVAILIVINVFRYRPCTYDYM